MKLILSNKLLLGVVVLAGFLSFWKLGEMPLEAWDESRHGMNAWEMLQRNDFIRYYYNGEPDGWNAKPPLMLWLIALSFKLFGYSKFALRLPSALAAISAVIYMYSFIRLYRSNLFAALASMILLSTAGLVGYHVGRTGDTDALLVMLLMAFTYHFIKYREFGQKNQIWLAIGAACLAFYTKGPSIFLFVPGILLYLAVTGGLHRFIKDPRTWIGFLIFMACVISWFIIVSTYHIGTDYKDTVGENTWETMWVFDIFLRFTTSLEKHPYNPLFLFASFLSNFYIWHYAFYLAVLTGIVWMLKSKNIKKAVLCRQHRLTVISACLMIPVLLLVNFSQTKYDWYYAPAYPFVAVITAQWLWFMSKYVPYFFLFIALWLGLTLSKRVKDMSTTHHFTQLFVEGHERLFRKADKVIMYNIDWQDQILYLHWWNTNQEQHTGNLPNSLHPYAREVIFIRLENDKRTPREDSLVTSLSGRPDLRVDNSGEFYIIYPKTLADPK